jgi:hypothetical protein
MALRELFTNNGESQLDGAINDSVTSITVDNGSSFPLANFRLIIEDEILFCSSRSGTTLTVRRGAESTTPSSHADNTPVRHIFTAGALDAYREDLFASLGYGRRPTSGNTYGDEFDDESFTGFTQVESGSGPFVVVTERDHMASIYHPGGAAGAQFTAFMKNVGSRSSGDWISVCFRDFCPTQSYPIFGLFFSDGATYNSGVQAGFQWSQAEDAMVMRGMTGFDNATFSSTVTMDASVDMSQIHLKLEYRGTNQYHAYVSGDGVNWIKFFNNSNPCTLTPTYAGFGITTWGGSLPYVASVKNFRTSF